MQLTAPPASRYNPLQRAGIRPVHVNRQAVIASASKKSIDQNFNQWRNICRSATTNEAKSKLWEPGAKSVHTIHGVPGRFLLCDGTGRVKIKKGTLLIAGKGQATSIISAMLHLHVEETSRILPYVVVKDTSLYASQ
jgi:hypothetical protein